jgi:hypothetical protein
VVTEATLYVKEVFVPTLLERIQNLIMAPLTHNDMLWIAIPLIITLVALEFYFGIYKDEELGWNTALGNSMVLIFVGIDLLRRLYYQGAFEEISINALMSSTPKTMLALFILSQGMVLILISFFHALPEGLAFVLSSPLYVNLVAFFSTAIIYTNLPLDFTTALAAAIIFVSSIFIIDIIHLIIPTRRKKTNIIKIADPKPNQ